MTTDLELEAATATWLDRVAADPALEVEWVDLLSQLEYVGFRKITKSVRYDEVTLETLRHMAEEASHAFLMKSTAEKLGLPGRSWKDGPFSPAGWAYFQGLDRGVEKQVADPARCYPLVSVAVERRVLVLYPAYLERTKNPDVRKTVARILAQEKKHAALFDERELPASEVEHACRLEEKLWAELIASANKLIGSVR